MTQDRFKFRAWDTEKKAWKGLWIFRGGHSGEYEVSNTEIDILDLNSRWGSNVILMQCTGIKDMEGKDVYEGDILEYKTYYANIKWWSSVEEIPIIAERTEQQRQDFSIERREVRFNQGAFCLGYTPLEEYCRNNILIEKLESGKQFNGDYEKKQWDFKVIGNIYDTRSIG